MTHRITSPAAQSKDAIAFDKLRKANPDMADAIERARAAVERKLADPNFAIGSMPASTPPQFQRKTGAKNTRPNSESGPHVEKLAAKRTAGRPNKRHAPAQHRRARQQANERRRLRELQRDDRILDKVTDKIRSAGGTIQRGDITRIPSRVWTMAAQIIADPSGRTARIYLARMPSRAAAGAILRAATENGQAWADMRARRIAALGVALEALSKRTRRPGPWSRIVMGITRPALCSLLSDPFDSRARATPSVSAGFNEHRPGATEDLDSNQIGYFRALARNGAAYAQQVRTGQLAACERGFPSGHPPNRYWLAAEAHEQDEHEHRDRLSTAQREANADADELDRTDTERRAERAREPEHPPA